MGKKITSNQDLLDHMIEFSRYAFQTEGKLIPMWLLQNAKGMIQPILTPFGDAEEKRATIDLIRETLTELKAVRYGFMSEAWVVSLRPGHPDHKNPEAVVPSEHGDRREIVKLLVEDDQGAFLSGHFYILRPEVGSARLSPFSANKDFTNMRGAMSSLFTKVKS